MTSKQDNMSNATMKHRQQQWHVTPMYSIPVVCSEAVQYLAKSHIEQGVQVGSLCQPKYDTAMKGDTARPVFCGGSGLLSPMIPNRIQITMTALYLVPRPIGPESSEFPPGMIHRASELCPFKDDTATIENERATCCAFAVDDAALYLRALNSQECLVRILEEKSPDQAIAFADELAAALVVHTKFLGYAAQYISGSSNPSLEGFALCEPKSGWQVSVVKALKRLDQAVEWHRTVGLAGCSVALKPKS